MIVKKLNIQTFFFNILQKENNLISPADTTLLKNNVLP